MKNHLVRPFWIVLIVFLGAIVPLQAVQKQSLEDKIYALNNQLKYTQSEKILLAILNDDKATDAQKLEACILMSNTFKRVYDYLSAVKYLKEGHLYAHSQADHADLKALECMALFDTHEYQKSSLIMTELEKTNFAGIDVESVSIIEMQQAYIFFRAKKYAAALRKYQKSLANMDAVNSCNQPIVYAKMIELYAVQNQMKNADSLYQLGMQKSESCGILKYKMYLTEEYMKCLATKNPSKYVQLSIALDSMTKLYNANESVSALHQVKNEHSEEQLNKAKKDNTAYLGVIVVLGLLLVVLLVVLRKYYQKRKKLQAEYLEMRKTFDFYANNLTPKEENKLENLYQSNVFSARQKQVLELILEGCTNQEMTTKLNISENTVKYHVKNIYKILADNQVTFERYREKNL